MKDIVFLLLSLLLPTKEDVYVKDFLIHTDEPPLQTYWISDDVVLFSYIGYAEIFNLNNRMKNKLDECKNCIYGYDKELVKCEYIHRDIHSMDEFSTTIKVSDINGEILLERDVFPTVVPFVCKKDYVLLRSAYSFLEQKRYVLTRDEIKGLNVSKSNPQFKGITEGQILTSCDRWVVVKDTNNYIWVYSRK